MELDYVRLKLIKPALSGYIRGAQVLLKKAPVPDEKAVHDIRVLMKKSRAALKLVTPQLDKEYFEHDAIALREVGRIMRSWREASIHRRLLKELRKENPALFLRLTENEKIAGLIIKSDPNAASTETLAGMEQITTLLNKTAYRIRFEQMNKIDPQLLLKEIEGTYSSIVDIYIKCRNNPKPENIHEFRKRSKDFLYQIYFFRPLNLAVIKGLEKKLDSLTQNLGKVNDLSQLINALEYSYNKGSNEPAMDELILLIREKQDRYLNKVWPVAYKIFCPGQVLVNVLGFRLLLI